MSVLFTDVNLVTSSNNPNLMITLVLKSFGMEIAYVNWEAILLIGE